MSRREGGEAPGIFPAVLTMCCRVLELEAAMQLVRMLPQKEHVMGTRALCSL